MANICPICQKDDLIQRIETLVSASQSSGTFSGPTVAATYSNGKLGSAGGYTTLSGSTTSNLAKLLEPPSLPPTPKGYGCWWILIASVIPLAGLPFSLPFLIPGVVLTKISSGFTDPTLNSQIFGLAIALIVIGACIGYWLAIRFFINNERKKKAKMQETYSIAKPKWEIAMQRWKRLYYCHRDGIVYDPETGETCDPASVNGFVYKQA